VTGSPQPTDVERAAIKEGYRALIRAKSPTSHLVELVVFGLSEAGMLQSPESAAHLERLTKDRDAFRDQRNGVFKTNERLLEELQEEQVARLRAENETRTVTRSLNAVTSRVDRAEQRRAELEAVLGSHRDGDRKEIERLRARVAVLESERAERNIVLNDVQVENAEFRARIAELEALVESMCAALTGHDCPDPAEGPMATVTRSAIRLMEAEARVAELEAAPAENTVLFEQAVQTGQLQVQVEQARTAAVGALELLDSKHYGALRVALEGMAGGASRAEAIPAARDVRPVEDPHDSPLHHAYRVARDLPAGGEAS
jgi:hypothetical protein